MIFWRADGSKSAYKVIGFEKADKFLGSVDAALN
jgi:thiol:disulfide interchange protein DsbD